MERIYTSMWEVHILHYEGHNPSVTPSTNSFQGEGEGHLYTNTEIPP